MAGEMKALSLPRVIGHRGAAGAAPENTRAGFRRAAALGAAWVELDVQLSADGVPVVFHDDRLERTTNGRGLLVETPFDTLRGLDAGSWFSADFAGEPLPSLADALACLAELRLGVNLEIKADEARGEATARAALELAQRLWPARLPAPLVSSFSRSALLTARAAAPDWPRGLLVDGLPEDWRAAARAAHCQSLHAEKSRLNPARIREIKAAGLRVLAYTVNSVEQARRLWSWGVDALFTDRPERLAGMAPGEEYF